MTASDSPQWSNKMDNQQINLTPEQMGGAISAGLRLLGLETTLIPGNMRKQLDVLEVVLTSLAQGHSQVVPTAVPAVESDPNTGDPAGSGAVIDGVHEAIGAKDAESHTKRETEEAGFNPHGEKGRPETGDGICDSGRQTSAG